MTQSVEENKIKQLLDRIANRRARVVVEHILEHGFITTEQLQAQYGYNHPPRAVRDVRESGIPLETFRIKSSQGRTIAAYRFGDLNKIRRGRTEGRRTFLKNFKDALYAQNRGKCAICAGSFENRYLQVDHRVPYEVAGEMQGDLSADNFILVCGSCNRAKSWSCEHCANWLSTQSSQVCLQCYWANPENHVHVALREVRRADILWDEGEIQIYEHLKRAAAKDQFLIPEYVKKIIASHLNAPQSD
jgi:hypothetical protein